VNDSSRTRLEHDSLGTAEVPADAYWGIHTARAVENFPISGRSIGIYPDLITAYACVKQAAARANAALGDLEPGKAAAIDQACDEIRGGGHWPINSSSTSSRAGRGLPPI
jgi:aspartate ammonia-lyase